MGNRAQLQTLLEGLLGSHNVYFQPPETLKMSYPCIVYSHSLNKTKFADDIPYNIKPGYILTIIDANPESEVLNKIEALPMCIFDRHYVANNLNHYIYNLYY